MGNGWIKAQRDWMGDPVIWKDAEYFMVWMYLQFHAAHEEKPVDFEGRTIILRPGQLVTGRKAISESTGVNGSKVYRVLNRFKSERLIEQQSGKHGSLISLLSDGCGVQGEQQSEQQLNSNRTATEQQPNTNKKERIREAKKEDKYIPPSPQGVGDGVPDEHLESKEPRADGEESGRMAAGQGKKHRKADGVWSSRTNVENLKALMNFGDYGNKRFFREHPAVWECAKAWMAYKDARKPRAPNHYANGESVGRLLDKLVRHCEEYGDGPVIAAVDDSMANNYQGIVWDRLWERKGKVSPATGSRRGGDIDWDSVK